MRHPTRVPLDPMEFPLTLAGRLRATFDDLVSDPLPEPLAALTRRLSHEWSEGEPAHGASTPKRRTVLIVEDDAELRSLTGRCSKTSCWTLSNAQARKLSLQPC
jgi:hypothetical protein